MNIMNGSLKGRVYEGLEEKAELASALIERAGYRIAFVGESERELYKPASTEGKYTEAKRN